MSGDHRVQGNLLQIASRPDTFYNQPNPGQLKTIFGAIAADIGNGSSSLIDDSVQ